MKLATKKRAEYNLGYDDGLAGIRRYRESSADYETGYDHGKCDRPTLDEVMPIDIAKERRNPLA